MKKTLSILLSFVMLLSITAGLDFSAYADISIGDYEYYVLDDDTVEITKYNGDGGDVSIPSTLDGYTVTDIGAEAFSYCTSLISVTIPDSITTIDKYAFDGCESLTSVIIPDSVISIGRYAFSQCESLTNVTIPDSVTNIGDGAFGYCTNLTNINVDSNNKNYSSKDGVLFDKDKTKLIQYPIGNKRKSYIIPNSITSFGLCAFESSTSLTSVTIPNSVTSIGDCLFMGCIGLTSIAIPNSVSNIGDYAFRHCTSLTSVTIPDTVTSIGKYAFRDCISLTSITIPDGVTSIDYCVFYYCASLTSITIPNSVTIIDNYAFDGCESLTDVYYCGTKNEWKSISVGFDNECITNATIHYNATACYIAGGHTYDSGTVKKPATCMQEGVMTYTCTVCGEAKTETIAKTAHTYKTTTTKSTLSKNGSVVTECSVCGNVKSNTTIYYPKTITLSSTSYTYDSEVKKPSVTVKDSKGNKIASSNYTVTYASGRKNVGKYTVTIKFKGNYSGTVTKTFTIKPKSTSISKLTAGRKAFTVKWKKQATQTTGYQIQYSTSSKFTNAKTVTVSKNSTTSKTISKLSAKKKYYVRIRTYKTVKVNGKSTKIYSSWSKAKTITTKK